MASLAEETDAPEEVSNIVDTASVNAVTTFRHKLMDILVDSSEEEKAIQEMRENAEFADLPQETIVRFLRARDLSVKDATAMLNYHLEFRKQWMKDEITVDEIMPALQSGCWCVGGLDKDGSPILLVDTRLWNPADYSVEIYVKYLCFFYERCFSHREFYGIPENVHQVVVVFDMQGWSYSDAYYLKYIHQLVNINQNQYPERLKRGFLINCPWIFKAAWAIIKPWIDKKTVSKLEFTTDNNLTEKLTEYIPIDILSEEYGGRKKVKDFLKPNLAGVPNYVQRSSRIGNMDTVAEGEEAKP
jgi:hypothetical protein